MKNRNKNFVEKWLIFAGILPLFILVFSCSGQLQVGEKPPEIVKEEVKVPVLVQPVVPVCTATQYLFYDQTSGQFSCKENEGLQTPTCTENQYLYLDQPSGKLVCKDMQPPLVPTCAENEYLYYDQASGQFGCEEKETILVPTCTATQELVFDPGTNQFSCIEKMTVEKLLECAEEGYVDGKCMNRKAYPFMVMGSAIPQIGLDRGCTYWVTCRLNTTVGSDFNGDGIDDISISGPTATTFNLLTHLTSSTTKDDVTSWMDIIRRILAIAYPENFDAKTFRFLGSEVHVMLMTKDPKPPFETQNMSQIVIMSPSQQWKPSHMIGLSTTMQDVNNDELADLIFTSNHLESMVEKDSVYIMFGSDKISPFAPVSAWKNVQPKALLGKDEDNNGKMDMIEISFPSPTISVQGVTTFDYDNDGRKDLAISAINYGSGSESSVKNGLIFIFNNSTLVAKYDALNASLPSSNFSIPVAGADFTIRVYNGTVGEIDVGPKLVGVDLDRDRDEELAVELKWSPASNVSIGGVAVFDTDGNTLNDPEKFAMEFIKNPTTTVPNNFLLKNLIMNTWGVDYANIQGRFNRKLISLTSANLDRLPGENIKNDDLIFSYSEPVKTCVHNVCNQWVSEYGRRHVVWIAKGNSNFPANTKDMKLFTGIWGSSEADVSSSEGPDELFASRCPGLNTKLQFDKSALGAALAVIPGGDRPDSLLISDPSYDLEGYCAADYRLPRVYLFAGMPGGSFADEYHATRNGIDGIAKKDGSGAQPFIQLPQGELLKIMRLWGWHLGLIGNTRSELDPFNEYELLIGAPQMTETLGEEVTIYAEMAKVSMVLEGVNSMSIFPEFPQKDRIRDYSGIVDFWPDALQMDYDHQYPDITIKPSEGDYVDLSILAKLIDGVPGEPWEDIFMNLMADKTCTGRFTCEKFTEEQCLQMTQPNLCHYYPAGNKCLDNKPYCELLNDDYLCQSFSVCEWDYAQSTCSENDYCGAIQDQSGCVDNACKWDSVNSKCIVDSTICPYAKSPQACGLCGPQGLVWDQNTNTCSSTIAESIPAHWPCENYVPLEKCEIFPPLQPGEYEGCIVEKTLPKDISRNIDFISKSKLGHLGWTMSN